MTIELMIQYIKLPGNISCLFEEKIIDPLCQLISPLMQNSFPFKRQERSIGNKSLTGCDQILNASNHKLKT